MVEPLKNRSSAVLVAAVARMATRLAYLGFPLRRVHSDRAGELGGSRMKKWAQDRQLLQTFTSGSDWKSNGRAEAEIGFIRRCANVVLHSTGVSQDQWPMVIRHV